VADDLFRVLSPVGQSKGLAILGHEAVMIGPIRLSRWFRDIAWSVRSEERISRNSRAGCADGLFSDPP
jgi:hypothetical protein